MKLDGKDTMNFEDLLVNREKENLRNTPRQRRELEDLVYKDKSLGAYQKMLHRCSEILGRNITGVGMMYRSEIARCLRELKKERGLLK